MKRNLIVVLFILVSLMSASCSKSVFSNGEPITESHPVDRFRAISMYNNVNVNLVHDSRPRLELTCPANLIDKITTETIDGTLVIKNRNTFNWLRSTDYSIDLTVYYDSIYEINYASIGTLRCMDSLTGVRTATTLPGSRDTTSISTFTLNINEGSGDIDIALQCGVLKNTFGNGTSHVILRGEVGYCEHITRSYGLIDARDLNSNITVVESQSTNDVYVWVQTELIVQLYNIGNVYYKGTPHTTIEACTSNGRLIPL